MAKVVKELEIKPHDKCFIQRDDNIDLSKLKYVVTYEEVSDGIVHASTRYFEDGEVERVLVSFEQIYIKTGDDTLMRIKNNELMKEFGVCDLFGISDGDGKPFIKKCFNDRKACLNVIYNVFANPDLSVIKSNWVSAWYELSEVIYKGGYTVINKGTEPIMEFVYIPEKLRSYRYQDFITVLGFEPVPNSNLFMYRYFVAVNGIMVDYAEEIGAIKNEGAGYVDADSSKEPVISSIEGSSVHRSYYTRVDVVNSVGNTGIISNFCRLVFS